MRLPVIVALGLLASSFAVLLLSLSGHQGTAVEHLVTDPGAVQVVSHGEIGLAAPSGTSPFAVYQAPPAPAPTAAPPQAPAPPPAPTPPPPARLPGGGGGGHHHH